MINLIRSNIWGNHLAPAEVSAFHSITPKTAVCAQNGTAPADIMTLTLPRCWTFTATTTRITASCPAVPVTIPWRPHLTITQPLHSIGMAARLRFPRRDTRLKAPTVSMFKPIKWHTADTATWILRVRRLTTWWGIAVCCWSATAM